MFINCLPQEEVCPIQKLEIIVLKSVSVVGRVVVRHNHRSRNERWVRNGTQEHAGLSIKANKITIVSILNFINLEEVITVTVFLQVHDKLTYLNVVVHKRYCRLISHFIFISKRVETNLSVQNLFVYPQDI